MTGLTYVKSNVLSYELVCVILYVWRFVLYINVWKYNCQLINIKNKLHIGISEIFNSLLF